MIGRDCPTGKRVWGSAKHARQAHRKAKWRVRVYRCEHCRQLHVTHEKAR